MGTKIIRLDRDIVEDLKSFRSMLQRKYRKRVSLSAAFRAKYYKKDFK